MVSFHHYTSLLLLTCLDCLTFAKVARVEYKLIVDGKWIIDPLNPNKIDNGVGGENSFFAMPDYKPTIWDKEIKGFDPTLETIEIKSKVFGQTRKIQIYAPTHSATEAIALPVLYLQDGTIISNVPKPFRPRLI